MLKLDDIRAGMHVSGLVPGRPAKIVAVDMVGSDALQVYFTSDLGPSAQQLYRTNEPELSIADSHLPWTFEAPAAEFKLALEAERISLGYLFDPMTMPPELRKAHEANDAAVLEAYGFDKNATESEIVSKLFEMYAKLTEKERADK